MARSHALSSLDSTSLPAMSLRALRTLVAIARHRTFAHAGQPIGLTQSAFSLQVKSLKEASGCPGVLR